MTAVSGTEFVDYYVTAAANGFYRIELVMRPPSFTAGDTVQIQLGMIGGGEVFDVVALASNAIDAPPHRLSLDDVLPEVKNRDLVVLHTSTPSFASDVKTVRALKNAKPLPVHANVTFDLDEPDMEVFATFHEKLQEAIKRSPEWARNTGGKYTPPASWGDEPPPPGDDDIPF